MAETQAQSSSGSQAVSTPATSLSDLHGRLDSLWISYLRHLDAYTTAQKTLQQHMRSGFFSLSRANFNARPGMRYGKDYFHDRAVATRRVSVSLNGDEKGDGRLKLAIFQGLPVSDGDEESEAAEKEAATANGQQQPSPPATPGPDEDDTSGKPTSRSRGKLDEKNEKKYDEALPNGTNSKTRLEADPLRWYGILVPRELRSAQALFSTAVDQSMLDGVDAGRAMRETEVEIRKLRKEIRRAEKAMKG